MIMELHCDYFKELSAMLPKIINQVDVSQTISQKYSHKPSACKKRKRKEVQLEDDPSDKEETSIKKSKNYKGKAVSVESMPSLDINELKQRLKNKITESQSSRSYSQEKMARRKLKRKLTESKMKNKIEKSLKVPTTILDENIKPNIKQTLKVKNANLQFNKFETKTKDEVDLQETKRKKKKKNLDKLLEKATSEKKELKALEKSTDSKAADQLQNKAWKKAISMAKGEKQKDNPDLIKKTIKRTEQKKKKSTKEWSKRIGGQKKLQKEKASKRQENIDKRKAKSVNGKKKK